MPLNSICRTIAFSALCVSVAWARGGENPRQLSGESAVLLMQDAARLIASGSLGAAEASYNTILQGHPDNKRSEEHTSELQSRGHLVCRLLLEKKKNTQKIIKKNKKYKTLLRKQSRSK